jgi:hypothetical protein
VTLNFSVENIPASTTAFKIAYGESENSLSNEVITYPIEKIKRDDGSYSWYIDKLAPKTYSFKIFSVMSGGALVPDFSSEALSAVVGKGSCSIGNVSTIKTLSSSDKTILSWDALSGALSYNIYRLSAAKDYELIENVKTNTYTIFLSSGALSYQDFAVRALCDSKTESSVPSTASRVQT